MGSAPSPPITAFDLDHHSRLVYTDKKAAKQAGVFIPGVKTTKVVQAMLHVDDCIYFSKIHCSSCLGRIAAKIWPKDVAPKLEAAGQSIEYLHIKVHATPKSIFTNCMEYSPIMHNQLFCKGVSTIPKVAKFPQYLTPELHPLSHLQPVVWGKASIITNSCRTTTADFFTSVCCLASEGLLLGWPPKTVGAAMASLPKAHRGPTPNFIRLFGQLLRKSRAAYFAWFKATTGTGDASCAFPWFSLCTAICNVAKGRFGSLSRYLHDGRAESTTP